MSERTEPRFALWRCPARPHITKVKKVLHQILRSLCTRKQVECFRNDARRLQVDEERAEPMIQMPLPRWIKRLQLRAHRLQKLWRRFAQPAAGDFVCAQSH